jgi:hypothetical protein
MTMMQVLPAEIVAIAFDFGELLGSGETISTIVGVVADPTGELSIGTSSISGEQVVVTVTGTAAVAGRRYELTATITTSAGQTRKEHATIAALT